MKEVTGIELSFSGSAGGGQWSGSVNRNNCRVDNKLESQCVAEKTGHVAFVEFVSNTHVYYTEANWTGHPIYKVQKVTISEFLNTLKYKTFIHAN